MRIYDKLKLACNKQKLLHAKFTVTHTKFVFLFTSLMYVIYNLVNIEKLTQWFYYKDKFSYFGFFAYVVLGYFLFVFIFALIAHKYTTKFISLLLVSTSAFITYFIVKYNIAMDTSMLTNVIHTDTSESLPLASTQMLPYVLFLLVVPATLILRTEIIYDRPLKHLTKTTAIVTISFLLALGSIYASFKEIHRAANLSNRYILYSLVPLNFLTASIDVVGNEIVRPVVGEHVDEDIEVAAETREKGDLVVVLAIGEAIRQKNLNLYGYERTSTTPLLSQYSDLHVLNGKARLGSTLYALKEILRKDDVKLTNVVNSAGIDTSIYSNYTLYNDSSTVEEVFAKPSKYSESHDEDVIPLLEQNLKNYTGGYRFILLHFGGGAHGPIYNHRIPKDFHLFTPACEDPDMLNACNEEQRYNAYDNGMRYQDYVIDQMIKKLEQSNAPYVMIFTSDHGESLGENGYVFHGMPPGMDLPKEQAEIPLLVKSSVPIEVSQREVYTQPDIFDTVLALFTIETKEFDKAGSFIKR